MLAATFAALLLSTTTAEAPPGVVRAETGAPAARQALLICNRDEASRRAYKRQYGKARYVSAQDVVDSRAAGETWSTPRCITPAEFSRLEKMVGEVSWAKP
jgi:hypothetical protein